MLKASLFTEDVEWYIPSDKTLPPIGLRSHRPEVVAFFKTMWSHFEPSKSIVNIEKNVLPGNDAEVFVNAQQTAIKAGKAFQTAIALHLQQMVKR